MSASVFDQITMLHEACTELRSRLAEAREALSDEEWETMCDGPAGEILCAAMDVEYWVEKFEES